MEVYPRIPDRVWYALRICTVVGVLAISGLAIFRPDIALPLFWRAILPWLPLIFFVAPGVWRNVCPLAAANQTPRLFGFSRALTRPQWLQEYSYVIGIVLFLGLASSRKLIFETNGPATGLLFLCVIGTAFTMGVIFKGKSGWCSSICPLLRSSASMVRRRSYPHATATASRSWAAPGTVTTSIRQWLISPTSMRRTRTIAATANSSCQFSRRSSCGST
jgi:hypothetical protein